MSKKKIVIIEIIAVVIAAVAAVVALESSAGTFSKEEQLGDNQQVVYGYISSIEGNEMTYMELDESVVTAYLEQASSTEDASSDASNGAKSDGTDGDTAGGGAPGDGTDGDTAGGGAPGGGDMPSGDMPSGDMPSGDMPSGDMPGGDMSGDPGGEAVDADSTEMGEIVADSTEMGEAGASQNNTSVQGESKTILIPVGVTVHTSTDSEVTFSRLAAGDMIKMIVETNSAGEEVVTEIWML